MPMRAVPAPQARPRAKLPPPPAKKPAKKPAKQPSTPVGAMTPEDFAAAASEALGGRGWQKAFVRGTGLAPSTVTRYLQGIYPIPQHVALIVEMMAKLRHHKLPMPECFGRE